MAVKQKEKKPLHLAKMNIHKGDTVLIITGKDKGKEGTVSRAFPQNEKVIVEGHNIVKKHVRPRGQTRQGGVIEKAMPIHVSNVMKVVINIGMGEVIHSSNPRAMDNAVNDLATITGQRPVITRAKRSVAAFKLREGMQIGCMVTLRGERMYQFLDKLMNVALPRLRDFQGVSADAFDGRGNYTLGLREQLVFPEIDYDKVDKVRGMEVSIVTTARTDEEGRRLLKLMGMPFKK